MSRFKVWKEGIESKDGDILLRLIYRPECTGEGEGGGGVYLCAVDKDGDKIHRGDLLSFHDNCALRLLSCVNKEIGFQLDDDGEIFTDEPLIPYKPTEK